MHAPPSRAQNIRWTRSNSEKADASANHLAQVYSTEFDDAELDVASKQTLEEETIELTTPKGVPKETNRNRNSKKHQATI